MSFAFRVPPGSAKKAELLRNTRKVVFMSLSNITLSASVRQNLLSLQDTADLLSTTQTRLATGKKVNSALDNPTNFFTASGLDARASDIGNLLDSIGNGVQVLQAANTGITSLSKLVDTAKSIANQALQQSSGYSTKANLQFTGAVRPALQPRQVLRSEPGRAHRQRFHVHKLRWYRRHDHGRLRRLSPTMPPPRRRRSSRWTTSTRPCRWLASI